MAGTAMAAIIKMIATTIRSSMREKPFGSPSFFRYLVCVLSKNALSYEARLTPVDDGIIRPQIRAGRY
jgi:hypothetical protein